jgi:putative transcriptional regulator
MAVSYKKLWHILIDRGMKKLDLEMAAGITHYQMYKLAGNKDITTDVIEAICRALDVEVGDILEFVPDGNAAEEPAEPEKRVYYTGDRE